MTEPVVINKARDVFQLFEEKLKEAVLSLDLKDQVGFDILPTLDGYVLNHSRGIFGLLYNGEQYSKDERIRSDAVIMKNDLMIGVVSIIRFIGAAGTPIEKYPMLPMEYPELAVNTLSGIEIENKRPEYERKIIPVRTELVDEERGVWKYLTTFSVPRDFYETSLRV
jgi:hypothetical protein